MNRTAIQNKIKKDISKLDETTLQEVSDFITYLKHKDSFQASIELMEDPGAMDEISKGIKDKNDGNLHDWDSVK